MCVRVERSPSNRFVKCDQRASLVIKFITDVPQLKPQVIITSAKTDRSFKFISRLGVATKNVEYCSTCSMCIRIGRRKKDGLVGGRKVVYNHRITAQKSRKADLCGS